MRIAVLSDIHGNFHALEAVLKQCKKYEIDKYLLLGDYVGYYYEPKKVWDTICCLDGLMIKGNHEDLLRASQMSFEKRLEIKKKYGIGHEIALKQFSYKDLKKLYSLPEKRIFKFGNFSLQLNHGSPWDQNEYLYPDTDPKIFEKANQSKIDFVFVGHSHYPFIKKLTHSTIINPGSVGQNRQKGGIATWGFIDLFKVKIEIMKTKYSVDKLARKVKINDPDIAYNHSILFRS